MLEKARQLFMSSFGCAGGVRYFFAPGRVNLLGEHTDYNGGRVMPCALDLGIYGAFAPRTDGTIGLASADFEGGKAFRLRAAELPEDLGGTWTAYALGSWLSLRDRLQDEPEGQTETAENGRRVEAALSALNGGFDMAIASDLPSGAGLSSSAALEVLTVTALCGLFGIELSKKDIALTSQRAENVYAKVPCGIMDQFASANGIRDHALYLDTSSLEFEAIPLELGDAEIVLTDSRVKHSLGSSEYPKRRRECEESAALIKREMERLGEKPAETLCSLSSTEFDRLSCCIKDPGARRRARHAVRDNERCRLGAEALKRGDLKAFGELISASHVSLRDDFEVSCPELDLLAETAWNVPGVYGSRITGGGFGGCTVSIVKKSSEELFKSKVSEAYRDAFGIDCVFYTALPSDGARELFI